MYQPYLATVAPKTESIQELNHLKKLQQDYDNPPVLPNPLEIFYFHRKNLDILTMTYPPGLQSASGQGANEVHGSRCLVDANAT